MKHLNLKTMKTNRFLTIIMASVMLISFGCKTSKTAVKTNQNAFIKVEKGSFVKNKKAYTFIGANYWQGMNLGEPENGDQKRLMRELDQLQENGVTNLRVLAASEGDDDMKYAIHPALQTGPGEYNEDIWIGLDFLLSEMAKRNMTAVMVMGNFWTWSGGFPQYLKWAGQGDIPFPQDEPYTWQQFTDYSKLFYTNETAQKMMNNHLEKTINRKNSITGTLYKNDPTIMSWQLSNEPRGYDVPDDYRKWTQKTAAFIKNLDKNHMVCLGTEGNTPSDNAGINVLKDNDNPNIDYITMHIWAQNWRWFKPTDGEAVFQEAIKKADSYWADHVAVAKKLNKPIVLEEFGIARDSSSFAIDAKTTWRDRFYKYVFEKTVKSIKDNAPVKGLNFWSYSGEGRPVRPGEFWKKGDTFLGDPPHELQGWYGVYDKDKSTLDIIKKSAKAIR